MGMGSAVTDAIVADLFAEVCADVVASGTIVGIAVVVFKLPGEVVTKVITTSGGIVVVLAMTDNVVTGRLIVVGIAVVVLANGVV
jgi:hypothetical protein